MKTTMHVMAALGMLGATSAGANADDKRFRLSISIGECFPPVRVVHCEPDPCHIVRYREEHVWETVPRCEVWYDACGHRHERTVYERVCRTVRVPVYSCGHCGHGAHSCSTGHGRNHGWRGDDDDHRWRGGGHGYRGRDRDDDDDRWRGGRGRDDGRYGRGDDRYPQTWGLGDERRDGFTKEVKPQDRTPAREPARTAAPLPTRDGRTLMAQGPAAPNKDARTEARGMKRLADLSQRKP